MNHHLCKATQKKDSVLSCITAPLAMPPGGKIRDILPPGKRERTNISHPSRVQSGTRCRKRILVKHKRKKKSLDSDKNNNLNFCIFPLATCICLRFWHIFWSAWSSLRVQVHLEREHPEQHSAFVEQAQRNAMPACMHIPISMLARHREPGKRHACFLDRSSRLVQKWFLLA